MAVENSIRTNTSAFTALRTLNAINRKVETVQNRVSSGLKVTGAEVGASNFAIAQGLRAELAAYKAVNQGLHTARGVIQVALAAATGVSNVLTDMREKTVQGRNEGLTAQQRSIVARDFLALRDQFDSLVNNARFNDKNLIVNGSSAMTVLTNIGGGTFTIDNYQISAIDLQFGNADANLDNVANSEASDGYVVEAIDTVANALAGLAASARFIDSQIGFNESLSDAAEEGLGNIVDADMARSAAELTAVQVQQQLSTQTLSIANQRPSALLGLFS
ncbi:flagellin [Nisaea acidiphila]|uniref:Flagellin n=1 Tax=Nisaea acidiphila TaxID=1862145 RepID=A0A9J7ATX5_9PROT|nr:flagellin [Nisaea acidiphila]UUX50558.1 flagellin [Nisaea acidiphila]